jgi:LuxR family maltose regulon positive regulatory protein
MTARFFAGAQDAPLLETKLYIPPARTELVSRPRLTERLNAGRTQKLTLVSAPAGFGKTTLLTEWVHSGKAPPQVVWLSLDEGDNDPSRFLAYLIRAFQEIAAHIGEGVLGALYAPQRRKVPSEPLLATLINQINALPDGPFILVLDDYHLITAQPIHQALEFLLEHLPLNLHLVIATRADPPLHLARLRGRGELMELRAPDLRFTLQEAASFLNDVMGLDLAPEDISALTARTEGWIASLQMAALSMQKRTFPNRGLSGFVRAFTGSHRFILDYLVEEVLEHQPEALQEFLMRTSVLRRLTGPLCDAVTGPASSGQATLEALERDNLFILPLDDERRWYRYHSLFADLLRQRLRRAHPDLEPVLHRRASEWYEGHGLTAEAIEHALLAQDFERAVALIERAAEPTWARSEVVTFLGWVQALPEEVVCSQPRLGALYALALLMSTHPLETVQSRLQEAESGDVTGSAASEIALVRALIAAYQGDSQKSAELAQKALDQLPAESLLLRSLAAGAKSLAYLFHGEIPVVRQALEEAASISRQAGNVMNTVLALGHLAELSFLHGQLYAANDYYAQALEAATDEHGRQQPIACVPLIGLGELRREWNDLPAAKEHLRRSIELSQGCGEIWVLSGHIVLAQVRQAQGDAQGARAALQTAKRIAARFDAMQADDLKVAMNQARLAIVQGRLDAAERWVQERGVAERGREEALGQPDHGFYMRLIPAYEGIILARLRLAQGRPQEVLKVLKPIIAGLEAAGWTRFLLECLILRALAYRNLGEVEQALAALGRALVLAAPEGYVRLFIEEGELMVELLRRAASQGIAAEYAMQLLAACEPSSRRQYAQEKTTPTSQPLIEPLTERELDVLHLLTTHLSSTEIAEELFVAASTVRSHIKSIYGKLNVHNRSDAVQRAEELGLL